MTLRGRLLASVLVAIALVLAGVTAAFNAVLAARLDGDANGVVQARATAELGGLRVSGGRITLPEAPDEATPDAQLWVFHGTTVLERPQSAPAVDNTVAAELALGPRATRDLATPHTRLYVVPVIAGGRRLGAVVAAVSLAPYDQTRQTALIASVVLALVALLAVAIAAWWLISRALRPVARMTAQAAEWSDRDLDRRFMLGPPRDELTQLAFTLDGLLDRLAASLRHEQRLSAELSHELRTPLANVTAQAQYALRHTDPDEDGRRALEQMLDSARQMARTLDTLIAAARAELDPRKSSSDAVVGARVAVAAAASLGEERGVVARVEPRRSDVRVAGEQALIERILAPLIENAYRYARTTVTVTIDRDGPTVRFVVEDDGPGIPASEREAIFEPGRRAEPAAATTALVSTGAGLGLALSRRLARTAGGGVTAEPSDAGGRFVAELPGA